MGRAAGGGERKQNRSREPSSTKLPDETHAPFERMLSKGQAQSVIVHVFGLTGGFASGKSAVAARFIARGLPVIDADQLAREVVEPGSEGLLAVVREFGAELLDERGALDRKRLGAKVFGDPALRKRLEDITHPRIRALMQEQKRALAERGEPLACYEAPLLIEVGLAEKLRPLVVVRADEATQLERAARRDGLSQEATRARLAAQLPIEQKLALADYVIDNTGSLAETRARADEVLDAICRTLSIPPERYARG
jgi:dephospho-CoA kinase